MGGAISPIGLPFGGALFFFFFNWKQMDKRLADCSLAGWYYLNRLESLMATHEFFCHLTGAIHSADLPFPEKSADSHFLYCPFCGQRRVEAWTGWRNVNTDPNTEHWTMTHEWVGVE